MHDPLPYEAMEQLQPCPQCGSRHYWLDDGWVCAACRPCPYPHPITAELTAAAAGTTKAKDI